MTPDSWLPVVFGPLVLLGIYRRFRRNFGRQPVRPKRMTFRIAILVLAGGLLLSSALRDPRLLEGAVVGLLVGFALAVVGLRLTRFESDPGGRRWYTPHSYIGLAITLVLAGRLIYRFMVLYPGMHAAAQGGAMFAAYQRSPLTLGLLTALIGYYVVYYAGVLLTAQRGASRSLVS